MTSFSESVRVEMDGTVAVVVIDNPPVNALSHHVRRGLLDAMAHIAADGDVEAAVLVCAGRTFIAGADITEFDRPPAPPGIHRILDAIENCPKPVTAAMHGTAYGGGLETAMCTHYRVAAPSARFGQPEVKLGILPGAGGTQKLPRLVGVAKALEMCVTGDPIDAASTPSPDRVKRTSSWPPSRAPTGITSLPPSASWATRAGGGAGPAAVTTMAS